MRTYKEIMKKAQDKKICSKAWDETDKLTQDFLDEMASLHPDRVQRYLKEMEDAVCFPPLTEGEAQKYVDGMTNKDGSKGAHWNLAQVKELAVKHPELKQFDCLDFFVALNMMWSDHYNPKRAEEEYISLACEFLDDKDAPKNKMRRYMEVMK